MDKGNRKYTAHKWIQIAFFFVIVAAFIVSRIGEGVALDLTTLTSNYFMYGAIIAGLFFATNATEHLAKAKEVITSMKTTLTETKIAP